jgi:hypothetical protein
MAHERGGRRHPEPEPVRARGRCCAPTDGQPARSAADDQRAQQAQNHRLGHCCPTAASQVQPPATPPKTTRYTYTRHCRSGQPQSPATTKAPSHTTNASNLQDLATSSRQGARLASRHSSIHHHTGAAASPTAYPNWVGATRLGRLSCPAALLPTAHVPQLKHETPCHAAAQPATAANAAHAIHSTPCDSPRAPS